MIRKVGVTVCLMLLAESCLRSKQGAGAAGKLRVVMQEIMNVPDNIPQEVMEKAKWVIVSRRF